MSSLLQCQLGPVLLNWGDFHFIKPDETATATELDEFDESQLVLRYRVNVDLNVNRKLFFILPSIVGMVREILRGMKSVSISEDENLYLVEDCEFSLKISAANVGSDQFYLQLCDPTTVICSWHESSDQILFELSGILSALSARCDKAGIPIRELLTRCKGEVNWFYRE